MRFPERLYQCPNLVISIDKRRQCVHNVCKGSSFLFRLRRIIAAVEEAITRTSVFNVPDVFEIFLVRVVSLLVTLPRRTVAISNRHTNGGRCCMECLSNEGRRNRETESELIYSGKKHKTASKVMSTVRITPASGSAILLECPGFSAEQTEV